MNKIVTGIFAAAIVTAFAIGLAEAQSPTSSPTPTVVPQGAPSTGYGSIGR